VFLRGRDADARLRELVGRRVSVRSAPSEEERVSVRVPCSPEVSTKWVAAVELARRIAGENLPSWECAEAIAAECASTVAGVENGRPSAPERPEERRAPEADDEPGLRTLVWPHLRWRHVGAKENDPLQRLTRGLGRCSPKQLDGRFRRAIAFLQEVDLELGRVLKQVVDRKLYRELGFERYVTERDYADFGRDGFRCTVPACSARRNLHSHHIRFRSAGGPDVAWNRTYELGIGRFRSGGVRVA
jgi:hypothetical protein